MNASTTLTDPRPTAREHRVVSQQQWLAERRQLLAREKELTRLQDALAEQRRALPWLRIDQPYVFDTVDGPRALADLFDGRRQLLVQHFMLGPGWEEGCPSCSYMADHLGGMKVHLAHRDVSLLVVSRAPLAEIERFRQRMGWPVRWVSSHGNTFNFDFRVSFDPAEHARGEVDYNFRIGAFPREEAPGISVFWRDDDGTVYRTYSTYGRGVEVMMGTYAMLDLTPIGRDEHNDQRPMDWVRHHDRYEPAPAPRADAGTGPAAAGCCSAGPAGR